MRPYMDRTHKKTPAGTLESIPLALDAMAEDLVEEDRSGAARENRRAGVGIDNRSHAQRLQVGNHLVDGLQNGRVVG